MWLAIDAIGVLVIVLGIYLPPIVTAPAAPGAGGVTAAAGKSEFAAARYR